MRRGGGPGGRRLRLASGNRLRRSIEREFLVLDIVALRGFLELGRYLVKFKEITYFKSLFANITLLGCMSFAACNAFECLHMMQD